jgi:hypothetical protein
VSNQRSGRLALVVLYRCDDRSGCLCKRRVILRADFAAWLGATSLAIRTGVDASVRPHGCIGLARLADARFQGTQSRACVVYRPTRGQRALDLDILHVEARCPGVRGNTGSMVSHRSDDSTILAYSCACGSVPVSLPGLGGVCGRSHILYLAAQSRSSLIRGRRWSPECAVPAEPREVFVKPWSLNPSLHRSVTHKVPERECGCVALIDSLRARVLTGQPAADQLGR